MICDMLPISNFCLSCHYGDLFINKGFLFPGSIFAGYNQTFRSLPKRKGEGRDGYAGQCNPYVIRVASAADADIDPAIEPSGPSRTRMLAVLGAPVLFFYLALVNCIGRGKEKNGKQRNANETCA
jgi:hypothetical protein